MRYGALQWIDIPYSVYSCFMPDFDQDKAAPEVERMNECLKQHFTLTAKMMIMMMMMNLQQSLSVGKSFAVLMYNFPHEVISRGHT